LIVPRARLGSCFFGSCLCRQSCPTHLEYRTYVWFGHSPSASFPPGACMCNTHRHTRTSLLIEHTHNTQHTHIHNTSTHSTQHVNTQHTLRDVASVNQTGPDRTGGAAQATTAPTRPDEQTQPNPLDPVQPASTSGRQCADSAVSTLYMTPSEQECHRETASPIPDDAHPPPPAGIWPEQQDPAACGGQRHDARRR
jgi:hypothetical protein